jgi:hypothetical protein
MFWFTTEFGAVALCLWAVWTIKVANSLGYPIPLLWCLWSANFFHNTLLTFLSSTYSICSKVRYVNLILSKNNRDWLDQGMSDFRTCSLFYDDDFWLFQRAAYINLIFGQFFAGSFSVPTLFGSECIHILIWKDNPRFATADTRVIGLITNMGITSTSDRFGQ